MKLKKLIIILFLVMLLVGCGEKKEDSVSGDTSKNLYCEEGTLKDGKCEVIVAVDAKLTCETGYSLKDSACTKTETKSATSAKTCASGYTLSGNQCVSDADTAKTKTQVCEWPKDYPQQPRKNSTDQAVVKNGKCILEICDTREEGVCMVGESPEIPFTTKESCPSGTKEINGKCKKTATPTTGYTCEVGELNGKDCIINDIKEPTGTCEDDYLYNATTKMCEKINLVEAKEK